MKVCGLLILFLFANNVWADETTENQVFYQIYDSIVLQQGSKFGLQAKEMESVLRHVVNHPVATLLDPGTVAHYDPTGAIGFCFGRALATQLAARKVGLRNDSVRKIFVIGDMRSGSQPEWRFHVTTIVRGSDRRWYALDPIVPRGRVLTAEQWLTWIRQVWDRQGKTNAYMTAGDVIIPNLKMVPAVGEVNNTEVMSTTFQPETHDGVKKLASADRFYDVSHIAADSFQQEQFISAREIGAERFNASSIVINEVAEYRYNRYFADLLEVFEKTSPEQILRSKAIFPSRSFATGREMVVQERALRRQRNALGSPRFDLINALLDMENCLR